MDALAREHINYASLAGSLTGELRVIRINLNAVVRTMDPKDWRRDQLNDQIERIDRALSPHPQP